MTSQVRTIVIGDIHGCSAELARLFNLVSASTKDRIVSLGDIVDRGYDIDGCYKQLFEKKAIIIQGNHENRFRRWYARTSIGEESNIILRQTHQDSVDQINKSSIKNDIWESIMTCPDTYEFKYEKDQKTYLCAHAGLNPVLRESTPADQLLRIRDVDAQDNSKYLIKDNSATERVFWAKVFNYHKTVLFGHNVFNNVKFFPSAIGLDTGCCFGERLSALIIEPDGSIDTVSVKSNYSYTGRNLWQTQ